MKIAPAMVAIRTARTLDLIPFNAQLLLVDKYGDALFLNLNVQAGALGNWHSAHRIADTVRTGIPIPGVCNILLQVFE